VATLDRLGKATHNDWERLWLTDLSEKSCDVRRNAVEKLGQFGDKASIAAIKAAKKKDDAETHWWQFSCLGGKANDAETKILARR
jgi:HEAT repeat protein